MIVGRNILGIIITCMLIATTSSAQQLPLQNQYLINKFALNPAYAGHNNNFETFVGYRQNWMGVDGAPQTRTLSINGLLAKNMGIGGSILNDQIGIFNSFSATVDYSYHLKLADQQKLRFGVSAGVYENRIGISGAETQDIQDPFILNNQNVRGITMDAAFGALYTNKNFSAGVVLPNLFPGKIKSSSTNQSLYTVKNHLVGHLSYTHNLKSNLDVSPYVIVRKSSVAPLLYEAAVQVKYQKKVWLGLAYRKNTILGASLGALIYNKLVMNYTYEFLGSSTVMAYSSGTHEISVGFLLGDRKSTLSSIFNATSAPKKRPYLQWMN